MLSKQNSPGSICSDDPRLSPRAFVIIHLPQQHGSSLFRLHVSSRQQPLLFFHFHVAADGHPVDQHGEHPHNLQAVAVKGNELSLDPQTGARRTCMKLG